MVLNTEDIFSAMGTEENKNKNKNKHVRNNGVSNSPPIDCILDRKAEKHTDYTKL